MNKSVLMAAVVVIGMAAWMASGMQDETTLPSEPEITSPAKALMKVKIRQSSARVVEQFVRVQGHVEANRTIQIKVDIDGRVAALTATEGQRLQAGEKLLQISPAYRSAQLAEADAVLMQRKSDLAASINLKKRGLQSDSKVLADQAAVQTAEAQLARVRHELQETQVNAPFAGILNKRMVELGDYMKIGDVLGELVDDETVKVTGQVPQHSVGRLVENQPVDVILSNDQEMAGRLSFISPVADPVSRSYRVEVQIPNPQHQRIIGLSATLLLPAGEAMGHLLPGSVLGLNKAGSLQVKLVNDKNRVTAAPVEIIRTDTRGFWLSGLDDEVRIITIGQDFVAIGEEVDPVSDADLAPEQASKTPAQEN
ncbi:efflux RND transporter periplasmic adaptor subunit [uncultured Amphritea sp.]|uniref:efflux RND transporter periplasmic adaptor subunit n=1 Tax=uncultured Amphritea sp. TaxID=981605 RepID=UPI00262CD206|nr:efflux RND transporter periplasmic adaptor subunit [uncultured Amphritea sp.]